MTLENEKQVIVYTYDTTNRLHALTGAVVVAEGTALTNGQTDVVPADDYQFWNGSKWVDASQLITAYHYDTNGYWVSSTVIPAGSALEANETTVPPYDANGAGMYKPKFDTNQNKWLETLTKAEIDALTKPAPAKPTATDSAISALTAQMLTSQKRINQHDQQIAALTSELLKQAKANN